MPTHDQLEIIRPSGEIEFYDLDPEKGVTNIGHHPENDIVIDGSGVASFHAVIDHRQRPYHIVLLSEEGETTLGGQRLATNVSTGLRDWDAIEVNGYTLILLEGETVPALPSSPESLPRLEEEAASPTPETMAAPLLLQKPAGLAALPPDQADDLIVTEFPDREWTVAVEQTVACQVAIINGGGIVARFDVRVEGLDQSWVTVSPPQVNLNEGERATVTVSITPPRLPTSRAGVHPLAVVVTSPNYPGRMSRMGVTLIVTPYYEFAVGELSPKQQKVSWRRRSGEAVIPITNKGNSETPFRLEGEDDEGGCRFEFQVSAEEVSLVRQAELRLPPGKDFSVPVRITPLSRRLVALRKRVYSFTVTTTMLEGAQTPRSVMGQLKSAPLIGPGLLALITLCLAALVVFLLRPNPEPGLEASITATSRPNEKLTLSYDASRFTDSSQEGVLNSLNALFLKLTLEYKARDGEWQILRTPSELTRPMGAVAHIPPASGWYRLRAENWLSALLALLKGTSREVAVYVTPIEPRIKFESDAEGNTVLVGQPVTLYWEVSDAQTLRLEYSGIKETLQDAELESGQRPFVLDKDTTFTLVAGNSSWPQEVQKSLPLKVLMPTPVIVRFDVNPQTITQGESVSINWEVTGADSVRIEPLGREDLPQGDIGDQPGENTDYQLTAYKGDATNRAARVVYVNTPVPTHTPTPTPAAPEIQLFEVTPKEVVLGDNQEVRLAWSVTGETTNIEITAPDLKLSGLEAQDSINVTVDETTLFVLTAYNGELSRSTPAEVRVLEPTPTVTPMPTLTPTGTPTPTPTPTFTPTPFPQPVIAYFIAEGSDVTFTDSRDGLNGPISEYSVEAGSTATLSWEVTGAEKVTLLGFGDQAFKDSQTLIVRESKTYQLTAENNGGQNQVNAFVQVNMTPPQTPRPPYNITGQIVADTVELEWSYYRAEMDEILGFRIYRANVAAGGDFVPVHTVTDPLVWTWVDSPSPTCGKAYYVVAIYLDVITGGEKETDASDNSWYSPPCP